MDTENRKIFAFVSDEDVFHFFTIPDEPQFQGIIAGLQSRPLLVEVTGKDEMFNGGFWKYVDGEFVQAEHNPFADEDDYEVE